MQSKFLAGIVACLLMFGIASAQEYSIRANRGLNLRAAPRLDAAIADTVPAGAILQVVGKSGSWLQIRRDAGDVWLADWVSYSRIDANAPAESPAPTRQIDNCCFVDRQCQSDQEWIAGYNAFQNGQCVAPAQPQPATPAQPASSAPANVDNCCFVDRQCHSDADWLNGYWAFQNNQCPAAPAQQTAPSAPTRPVIQGSDRFVRHIGVVLDLMEREAPEWYNYVINGLSFIVEVPIPDQDATHTCTALAYTRERKAALESCWVNKFQLWGMSAKYDQLGAATAIVHEACHVHRYEAGFVYDAATRDREETVCRERGAGVQVALDPHQKYWKYTYADTGEPSINVQRRWCAEGYHPELYCPTFQRLRGG